MQDLSEDNYEEARKKKKRRRFRILAISVGAAVVLGIAAIGIVSYYYMNRTFSQYSVIRKMDRTDSNNVTYRSFQNRLLKYSRDGISLLDMDGRTMWNGGYEMEKPMVDMCGNYVAVADVGSKKFYVYDGEKQGVDMETAFPIGRIKVAANGKIAVLLHDVDSDVINIYDPYNTVEPLEVEVPTNVVDDGYPLDFDLSPDGESLVVTYMLANAEMDNKVCFYNFTEVGQDQNILVGGKSYEKNMVSNIEFVSDDVVLICHEDGFSIFKNMKKPELTFEKKFEDEIKSLVYDDENILLVTGKPGDIDHQIVHLFSFSGKEEMSKPINYKYTGLMMSEGEIIFTDEQNCHILRKNGTEKFSYEFGKKYDYFYPAERDNQYYYLDEMSIQLIQIG